MPWRFHTQSTGSPCGPCAPHADAPPPQRSHPPRGHEGRAPRQCPPRLPSSSGRRCDGCGTSAGRVCAMAAAEPSSIGPRRCGDLRFDPITEAIAAVRAGDFVVVLDDEDRENEGDLIVAADAATPQKLAFMVEHTSGLVCVGMAGADLDRLQLPLMVEPGANGECQRTAYTVSVDLAAGTSTGISASDRSATIRALADPASRPGDFLRPGHVFPLRAAEGGVLARPGHTEASVDLARLAGRAPAGVICEIVNREDGSMARTPQLLAFAARHGLKCVTIEDLMAYRLRRDLPVGRAPGGATRASGLRE